MGIDRLRAWTKRVWHADATGVAILIGLSFVLLSGALSIFAPARTVTAAAPSHTVIDPAARDEIQRIAKETQLLTKEYEAAVREIQVRIEQEHTLFALKFTLVGALLGSAAALLGRKNADRTLFSPGVALAWWAAVAVSAVLDVRLQLNTQIIQEHGNWIASLENTLLPEGVSGWETYFRGTPIRSADDRLISLLLNMDRSLLTWVLFIVAVYACIIYHQRDAELLRISRYALPLCLFLFALSSLRHFDIREPIPGGLMILVTLAGALFSWRWVRRFERRLAANAPAG